MYNSHVLSHSRFSSHPLHPPNSALLSGVLPPSTRCFLCYTVQVSESYWEERAIYILKRHLNTTEELLFLLCKDLQLYSSTVQIRGCVFPTGMCRIPLIRILMVQNLCNDAELWMEFVLVLHHDWLRSTLLLCIIIVIKKVTLYTRCPVFSTASVQKWIGRLRHWNKCHFWPHRLTLYVSTSLPVLTLPSFPLSSDPTYHLPPSAVPFCQSAHHRSRRGGGVGFVILASSTPPCSSLSLSFPSVAQSAFLFSCSLPTDSWLSHRNSLCYLSSSPSSKMTFSDFTKTRQFDSVKSLQLEKGKMKTWRKK